jgi:gliding motility-associated-like protein
MGDGQEIEDINFTYLYDFPGVYTIELTVFDEFCEQQATFASDIEIAEGGGVIGTVHFPNVFTPNADQVNRELQPYIVGEDGVRIKPLRTEVGSWFSTYEFLVYNRWGNLIFEGNRATPFWNGSIDGEDAPDGSYYYIVKYKLSCGDAPAAEESGHISLFRN